MHADTGRARAPLVSRPCRDALGGAGGSLSSLPALKALAAVDRTPLRRLEGHRSLPSALRAGSVRFGLGVTGRRTALAFGLAGLAALGLVLEILIVVEVLFTRREYEVCAAIHALENAILKFRHNWPPLATLTTVLSIEDGGDRKIPAAQRLFHVPASFLPVPLASQRLFDPRLLTRFQVKRVPFDFFDDVLLLHLALEAAQRIFQRLALLELYFSQSKNTSPLHLGFRCGSGHPRAPSAFVNGRTRPRKNSLTLHRRY